MSKKEENNFVAIEAKIGRMIEWYMQYFIPFQQN